MKKKFSVFLMAACLLCTGLAFIACGSDDDDDKPATANVVLNATNFPDEYFRAYVANLTGVALGEEIPAEKLALVTAIELTEIGKEATTLKGIEHFTALEYLDCRWNRLTSLDLTKNVRLKTLYCNNNKTLATLDVSGCPALETLCCGDNDLTWLDVSKNTALKKLECYQNRLSLLNVASNPALRDLRCFENQIKGAQMTALISSLPTVDSGKFYVISATASKLEGNVCTDTQVSAAKAKGWKVMSSVGNDYAGS
ncbi:MAG: hypothetical protein J6M53_05955 [Bacteroidaceae bacterium]|nr:hypothetical protein [Bacteroidaceae bacterium]